MIDTVSGEVSWVHHSDSVFLVFVFVKLAAERTRLKSPTGLLTKFAQ
jgi:hypothetical protein